MSIHGQAPHNFRTVGWLPGHDEQPIRPAEIFARLNIASPRQDQRTLLSVSLRRLAARDLVERIGDPALTPKNVGYLWRRAKPPDKPQDNAAEIEQLRRALKASQDERRRLEAENNRLRTEIAAKATRRTKGFDHDEFRLIQSCLHPDRVSAELRERYTRAFQIFAAKAVGAKGR